MKKSTMIERIKNRMGGFGVNIEAGEEIISSFVDTAVDMLSPYINDTEFITRTAKKVIDLSDENVVDVVKIYPNRPMFSSYEQLDLFRHHNYANMEDRMTMPMRISQIEDYINRSFRFDDRDKKLYIDDYVGEITIEVIKELSLESLKDRNDINWIYKYALALTKESVGRVRSKFEVNGAPYQTDGREIVQEGKDEIRELEDQLEQRGKGFFYITR